MTGPRSKGPKRIPGRLTSARGSLPVGGARRVGSVVMLPCAARLVRDWGRRDMDELPDTARTLSALLSRVLCAAGTHGKEFIMD
jgi:hypothetical protein